MKPNLLLLVLDTARADAFEPYGASPGSTPVIADLARRGATFPLALSASNWTLPSHASMFAGRLPRALGLRRDDLRDVHYRNAVRGLMRAGRDHVLAEVLRIDGYDTRAISANVWIGRSTGMDTGFDRFDELAAERRIPRGGLLERLRWWRARSDDGAARGLEIARAWAREPGTRPFFWFVNLMECHSPYFPPKPYNDLGPVERWRAVDDVVRYQDWVAFLRSAAGDLDVPPEAMARMHHLYRRSFRQMDDWLGAVLEELDRTKRLDDTLVVITSDHGENFGENGLTGHAYSLDQRLLHVPLVMAGAGAPAGAPPLFALPALARVICDGVGVSDHPYREDDLPDGLAVAQDEGFTARPSEASLARARQAGFSDASIAKYLRTMAAVTDGRYKLARYGEDELLFDLDADPLETTDVRAAHPEVAAALAAALDRADAGATVTAPDQTGPVVSPEQEAEITRRLEDLGYL